MSDNVVHLPRPRQARTGPRPLAFFVRVGRNDHREMLDLVGTGERGIFGFVIDAHHTERHRELMTEARKRDFDPILDPKTQPMGFVGSHNEKLAALPWGSERHHTVTDFEGVEGRERAERIVDFAVSHGFTQILGPTHLLSGPNDRWLCHDIAMMGWTADFIRASGTDLGLIYSLALPMEVLRVRAARRALVGALADALCDAIWLKIENFGDDATGEKTAAYIEACRDFHDRGLPVVADHVGGLPGLGALAFGAVGGIAHGVTMQQSFKAASWRRPPVPRRGSGQPWRVYLPQLDMLVKPKIAEGFLTASTRVRGRYGCRDTHCCPQGVRDMTERPVRHALGSACSLSARARDRDPERGAGKRAGRGLPRRARAPSLGCGSGSCRALRARSDLPEEPRQEAAGHQPLPARHVPPGGGTTAGDERSCTAAALRSWRARWPMRKTVGGVR